VPRLGSRSPKQFAYLDEKKEEDEERKLRGNSARICQKLEGKEWGGNQFLHAGIGQSRFGEG